MEIVSLADLVTVGLTVSDRPMVSKLSGELTKDSVKQCRIIAKK